MSYQETSADGADGQPPMTADQVTDAERAVLDKLLIYTVGMRDVAARLDLDDQWARYASASTVVDEVLANGWDQPDDGTAPDPPDESPAVRALEWGVLGPSGRVWVPNSKDSSGEPVDKEAFVREFASGTGMTLVARRPGDDWEPACRCGHAADQHDQEGRCHCGQCPGFTPADDSEVTGP